MTVYRKFYCSCTGRPLELVYNEKFEDEIGEPECSKCGASPSSDPKHTISFRDQEEWDD